MMMKTQPCFYEINEEAWCKKALAKDPGMYEVLFGVDTASGSWTPLDDIPTVHDFQIPDGSRSGIKFCFQTNLKGQLLWSLLFRGDMEDIDNMISRLYHPAQYEEKERFALIREVAIRPHFQSVKGYYEFLHKLSYLAKVQLYAFPDDSPKMDIDQVIQYFKEIGDEEGVEVARFHKFMLPSWEDVCKQLNRIMYHYRDW